MKTKIEGARNYWIKIVFDQKLKFEKQTHKVLPGHQYIRPGDSLQFDAINTDIVVFIPNARKLFQADTDTLSIPIPMGDSSVKLTVSDKVKSGKYPYAVYCEKGNDFAEGNTAPAMIVE